MSDTVKVLVVDDEIHARRGLRAMLAAEPGIEVVGECKDAEEAVAAIRQFAPDLVFLDIEMPDRSGLDVVAEIGPEQMPAVVFVTAFDSYAVQAFEVAAVDYVLKPFTDERLASALERARGVVSGRSDGGESLRRVMDATGGKAPIERFTVKSGKTLKVFHVDEIDWIEADEYYCRLHIGGEAHMIRQPIGTLEERLPGDRFARIHRSTIVKLDRIAALEPLFQGDCNVILKDGTRLRMSRRRREALSDLLRSFS
jgi:two-component system, LytTR family, response regulator